MKYEVTIRAYQTVVVEAVDEEQAMEIAGQADLDDGWEISDDFYAEPYKYWEPGDTFWQFDENYRVRKAK